MESINAKIKRWGNSFGIILPKKISRIREPY